MVHGNDKHSVEALQEVKILEAVKHPNIVAFREAFMTVDQQFLCIVRQIRGYVMCVRILISLFFQVMAYCESGDLDQQIKTAKKNKTLFSEEQVCVCVCFVRNLFSAHSFACARLWTGTSNYAWR
jgi:serine/threonine protein kinase